MAPSAERLAGAGLAFAALAIVALGVVARFELDREAQVHRELIGALLVKDSLQSLRTQMNDLRHSARVASIDASADALQAIERRSVEIDAELGYLALQPELRERATFAELERAARLLIVNARSARAAGATGGKSPSAQLEQGSGQAATALERALEAQSTRINERIVEQLRIGETLRGYVSWLLAGSTAVLVGLFGFYRWAKAREAHSLRRIEQLAHFDTLTALPNRTLLNDRLELEIARSRRAQRGFCVLLFDLDGFKLVNDTWGHAAGDRVLAMVAERSRSVMRESDTVGRLGGDEFLAILPETSLDGASAVAEKLRDVLAAPYPLGIHTARLGASIGVGEYPRHGEDVDTLLRATDVALYRAKGGGRNQVRVAAQDSSSA